MHDPDNPSAAPPAAGGAGGGGASRKRSSMSELSGGSGLAYAEMSKKPAGGAAPQHALFKAREREKKKAKAAATKAQSEL